MVLKQRNKFQHCRKTVSTTCNPAGLLSQNVYTYNDRAAGEHLEELPWSWLYPLLLLQPKIYLWITSPVWGEGILKDSMLSVKEAPLSVFLANWTKRRHDGTRSLTKIWQGSVKLYRLEHLIIHTVDMTVQLAAAIGKQIHPYQQMAEDRATNKEKDSDS